MFAGFFLELRQAKVPVSLREYLTLLEAMKANLASYSVDDFDELARAALVKDERNLDKFDRVFGHHFKGLETAGEAGVEIPEGWLRKLAEKLLTDEEKKQIAAMGGWDKLMEELRKRLAEQQGRHQGGSKWIGTAGTSPYGAYGYNPEGVRIGQDESRNNRAVKVGDKRAFKKLDYFYYHNCPYESLWRDAWRRQVEKTPTMQVLHTYDASYKLIFVGDASMSPYEIVQPGGSVEHWNEEAGQVWMHRLLVTYPKAVWLNPVPERYWESAPSIQMMRRLLEDRMFPLTLEGLDRGMRRLTR